MATTRQEALSSKAVKLEALYAQRLEAYGQLNYSTSEAKTDLSETYFQLANAYSDKTEYFIAVSYYYKASRLTSHHQSSEILFKANTPSNQNIQSSEESIVLPEDLEQQFLVALQYRSGLGVVRNDKKACDILNNLANQELASAQYNLGWMYQEGRAGIEKGPAADAEAVRYYRLAADQGHAIAQNNLDSLSSTKNTKAIRQCPIVILQKTLNWPAKEIEMLVNAEKLTAEMPQKLLSILMTIDSEDQLKFLPKDRKDFIKYVESMVCVVRQELNPELKRQYNDCLHKCVNKRIAIPSKTRGSGLFSFLPSSAPGPFQGILDEVSNADETGRKQNGIVGHSNTFKVPQLDSDDFQAGIVGDHNL